MGTLTTETIIFDAGTGGLTSGEGYLTIFFVFYSISHHLEGFLLIAESPSACSGEANQTKKQKMNVKPAIGFLSADGDAPFSEKVATILEYLNGNANYPSPTPALPVVEGMFDSFKTAAAEAAQGGVRNTAIRRARRAELVGLLRQLAGYVTATANGNLEKLLSSGFPVQKPVRTPIGPLPAPAAPVVTQGALSGSITVAAPPVYGASSYNWSVALQSTPEVDVQTAQTTGARTSFSDLIPGKVYVVSLNAVGAAGVSDWSDYGSLMVI